MRSTTKKQYETYLKQFIARTSKDLSACDHQDLLNFLEYLYWSKNLGYSAINTARSAITTILDIVSDRQVGKHNIVCRFMKGVFQTRPSLPRYNEIWDIDIVLRFLDYNSNDISLLQFNKKLATLLTMLSAQRVSTIAGIQLQDIKFNGTSLTIYITNVIKQTRPGQHQKPLLFSCFPARRNLCMVEQTKLYIAKTSPMRPTSSGQLLLTSTTPYRAASKDTISNWIRETLQKAGVNTAPHSIRSASSSKASNLLPLDTVLEAGGWSQKSSVFPRYYKKQITHKGIDVALLNA